MSQDPFRPRRLRRSATLRAMVRETVVAPQDLVMPLFVHTGAGRKTPIEAMPGCNRLSPDLAARYAMELRDLGVKAILLFGIPDSKNAVGSGAWDDEGPVAQATRAIKKASPDTLVIADVCLCEYTDHGHCGVIENGTVDNDKTLPLLAKMALCCARSGADIIAPSDMMDHRVEVIRQALDANGFSDIAIMSYAAKYASAFYGPFREAAGSAPQFGDRKSYQMDPPNAREAMREMELDEAEGADILMVKPALPYLDILRMARDQFDLPLAAYNVSGEYAMIKAAAEKGWLDEKRVMMEALTSIKRAGADIIITYFAEDAAKIIAKGDAF